MNHWIYTFTWGELLIALGIFLLFLVFRKIFTTYVFKLILSVANKAPTHVVTNVLLAFERPLRSFFVVLGIYAAFVYLPFPHTYDVSVMRILQSLIIFHIAWGLFNLSASSSALFTRVGKKLEIEVDQILLPFLSKLIRFAIVVMSLSIIADLWGYNVNGFVAGLGIGGLAFALAAQDSISNFIGGVIIITEKPFTLGDWIETPSVNGFVEDITFRSTKIRTFSDSLVVVPNSTLSNEPIENWSKMGKRQISFNLGVEYLTPRKKMDTCVARIEGMLRERDDIDQELIIVRFSEFNESSLDIFLYFFTKSTLWTEYMEIKQEVNLEIMSILEEEGVSIAYPTRRIHMDDHAEKTEPKQPESKSQL
ncbi:mechanosensitive ion channel protein [Salipaludibacillus keqinensis]|uniref:Mechanosensitive ion channel protein n=1 Tax=Salipaludibacillus keqinensis TaxID=2045207 RepID=A0A323TV08_9BACI|nr:mechanosensitive ion channel family protein [Salipaludibacillus keqinensis]PYZ93325.1 mechanosensitive ion channel protein [Salipaludibacillus keqinensis]